MTKRHADFDEHLSHLLIDHYSDNYFEAGRLSRSTFKIITIIIIMYSNTNIVMLVSTHGNQSNHLLRISSNLMYSMFGNFVSTYFFHSIDK